jgi:hypothetical protein
VSEPLRKGCRVWWQEPDEYDLAGTLTPGRRLNGEVKALRGGFTIVNFGKLGELIVPSRELTPTDQFVIYD